MLIQHRVLLRRLRAGAFAAAGLLLFAYAVWPWTPFARLARPPRTIVFYGFSILGDVIDHGVFPAFAKQWRKRTGEKVELVSSFAGSGTVTNQIILGVPAHLVLLSLELARGEKIEVARLRDRCQNTANRRRIPPMIGLVGFFRKGRG